MPADLQAVVVDAANAAGVDPDWYTSLIGNGEKGFANPTGVSPAGARGPAQLMPGTASDMGVQNINDPVQNLQGGARYLKMLSDRYNGDQSLATAAYNAGPGKVDQHGGVPPYAQGYVNRVMAGVAPPPQAELQQAFLASQGQATSQPQGGQAAPPPPNGPASPAPAPTAPGALPGQDELQSAFAAQHGGPGGTGSRQVDPQHDGSVRDAAGTVYTPDPQNAGRYLDPHGNSFEVDNGQATPEPPTPRGAAMPWDSDYQAVQDAKYKRDMAQSAAARDAPLPSVPDSIESEWNAGLAGLKADTGNWFQNRVDPDAAGRALLDVGRMVTSPLTGATNALLVHPISKVTGLPLGMINNDLLGLGPEGAEAVPSLIGGAVDGAKALLRPVVNPLLARVSQGAAEAQAGRIIASKASDLPAVKASLVGGPDVTVPGSVPTTFQQSGDVGLGTLERGVSARNPAPFAERRGDQTRPASMPWARSRPAAIPWRSRTTSKPRWRAWTLRHRRTSML